VGRITPAPRADVGRITPVANWRFWAILAVKTGKPEFTAQVLCPSSLPNWLPLNPWSGRRLARSRSPIPRGARQALAKYHTCKQRFYKIFHKFLTLSCWCESHQQGGPGQRSYPRPATPRTTRAMPARSAILSDVSDARQSGLIQSPRILMYNRSSWRRSKLQP